MNTLFIDKHFGRGIKICHSHKNNNWNMLSGFLPWPFLNTFLLSVHAKDVPLKLQQCKEEAATWDVDVL